MSELIPCGEVPTGSKVTVEANDISYEDVAEDESIVDIKIVQPTEVVKAE